MLQVPFSINFRGRDLAILVTESGFGPDDFSVSGLIDNLDDLTEDLGVPLLGVDVPNTVKPESLVPYFNRLALIRIRFPGMADGRGFSIARKLRQLGFHGRLRAVGHIIPDQFRAAMRVGFDELEISEEQAIRQPESQWQGVKLTPSYQNRMRGTAA